MNQRHTTTTLLFGMILILSACAGGISEQARSQVTYFGPFSSVQQQPEDFRDEMVMWGGKIIDTRTQDGLTEILVLQMQLDNRHRPLDSDQSQGRFLIQINQFLDPVIYAQDALITVVGRLRGSEIRPIGEMPYLYPVIDVMEINKWEPEKHPFPRFHIGIGIGGRL